MAKISSPLTEIPIGKTEISVTGQATLSYEHIENQPGSYEETLSLPDHIE